MPITWISMAGFIGLGLVALPVAIHLLVRQRTRTLPYPSLRFVHETALAAFRRRRIDDAALLACRVAIIAVAALALAGPIVHTPSRTASHAGRTVRAHVHVDSSPPTSGADLVGDAFRFASFSRAEIGDSIRDALRWIDAQPAASREIMFSGVFTLGSITEADLMVIPRDIGIAFVSEERSSQADQIIPTLMLRDGGLVLVERRAHLDADSTRVSEGPARAAPAGSVEVRASPKHQALAEAALRGALEQGVRWSTPERRVQLIWEDATDALAHATGVEIVRMPVPDVPSHAVAATRNALEAAMAQALDEPVLISREQLAVWTRRPGPPSPAAPPADEGDRRWLWALVLVLAGLEQWVRRKAAWHAVTDAEARVA